MIFILYLLVALSVVWCSNKAAQYVDAIDQKTSLSGAFIGGVLLSAVTSLPELFTSLSATLLLNKPGLSIGNILGSNLFNMAALSFLILCFFKPFQKAKFAKSHSAITFFVGAIYVVIFLNMMGFLDYSIFSFSLSSIIIVLLYILGVRFMSSQDDAASSAEDSCPLSLKQVIIRFVLVSILLICLSICITYITDILATTLNLGSGLAGALFLGIATSLPEVSSTIALFRMKSYNIAIGNIIGSNIFNFVILAVADLCYIGSGIYDFSDPKTISLLIFGLLATPCLYLLLKIQKKSSTFFCSILILVSYFAFLLI